MRLIEAIGKIADDALLRGMPLPTIYMPQASILALSRAINDDLGGRLYGSEAVSGPIQFDGVTFAAKPRVRVQAGRRVVQPRRPPLRGRISIPQCLVGD